MLTVVNTRDATDYFRASCHQEFRQRTKYLQRESLPRLRERNAVACVPVTSHDYFGDAGRRPETETGSNHRDNMSLSRCPSVAIVWSVLCGVLFLFGAAPADSDESPISHSEGL